MKYFVWRNWQNELRIVKKVDEHWWVDIKDGKRSDSYSVEMFRQWFVFFETSDEATKFVLSDSSENVKMIERIVA